MGALSPTHWAIIIILVLLLFGSRKLPDMARGMGQSLRIFKAETQELRNEGNKPEGSESSEGQSAQQKPAAVEKGSDVTHTATNHTVTNSEHVGDSR